MNDTRSDAKWTNREFVAMVRNRLDVGGHADIAISRSWIDEGEADHPFLLHVPVGPTLTIPLIPLRDFVDARDVNDIEPHVGHFADALVNLQGITKTLDRYARDVRRAAEAQIASARAEGLDMLVTGIRFRPTFAYHLSGGSLKEAARGVFAGVTIRHMSFNLRPTTTTLWVDEAGEVTDKLKELAKEQRQRQLRIAELEARGSDLEIDRITLDILDAHGVDAGDVLRKAWMNQCENLTVRDGEREALLSLVSSDGVVTASFALGNAHWNGRHLWFEDEELFNGHQDLVGKSLGTLVPHPAFTSRPIVEVENRHRDHISFDLSDKLQFDAETGRIWSEERSPA